MCEFLAGSLHACGHSRTRRLTERCDISYYRGCACPLDIPDPAVWPSICHWCQTPEQREERWKWVLKALREQSAALIGRTRAVTRLLPLDAVMAEKVEEMSARMRHGELEPAATESQADIEADTLSLSAVAGKHRVAKDKGGCESAGDFESGGGRTRDQNPDLEGAIQNDGEGSSDFANEPLLVDNAVVLVA